MQDHSAFFRQIQLYVSEHPDAAAHVSDHVAAGIDASLRSALERAADMEVALAVMIAKRYSGRDELVLSKLTKWNGFSAVRWDDTINMLEGKVSSNV